MKDIIIEFINQHKDELLDFASRIVQIQSYSTQEKDVVECIKNEMEKLGYDRIQIDSTGSIVGTVGHGSHCFIFDSHIDTVQVINANEWKYDPFGGKIVDGKLYGRGASDMKGSAAATVYAGYAMKELGLLDDVCIHICCSAIEEDYDGEGLYNAIVENNLKPQYAIICEPSHLNIVLGQRGRSVFKITTKGKSAHGAAPEKGKNAIYSMNKIIERIIHFSNELMSRPVPKGSIVISKIESQSVSLNAVADSCSIYIDRRTTIEETEDVLEKEMNSFIEGIDATWEVYDVKGTSYMNAPICLHSLLNAWEIEEGHPLVQHFVNTYKTLFDKDPTFYKWDFSTNGVATAGKLHIPTIGFGAGLEKQAHMTNEYCPTDDIIKACQFYTMLFEKKL